MYDRDNKENGKHLITTFYGGSTSSKRDLIRAKDEFINLSLLSHIGL